MKNKAHKEAQVISTGPLRLHFFQNELLRYEFHCNFAPCISVNKNSLHSHSQYYALDTYAVEYTSDLLLIIHKEHYHGLEQQIGTDSNHINWMDALERSEYRLI